MLECSADAYHPAEGKMLLINIWCMANKKGHIETEGEGFDVL